MARIVYELAADARLQPGQSDDYEVTFGDGGRLRLSAPALMPLLLVDGWRSEDEITQLASRRYRLPSGIIGWVFSRMKAAGLLRKAETTWRPLEWLEWPTHRCQGCGACCQGEWIGPLDPEFVARTVPRLDELRARYPKLEGQPAFVRLEEGEPALHLNSSSGQCVFLDDDMLCILHKEFGAMGKPAPCRTFPMVRFEDAARTRVGVGLMCLRHFDQVIEGDEPGGVCEWQAEHDALDGEFFHYYAPDDTTAAVEEELFEAVGRVEDPLEHVLEELTPVSMVVSLDPPARRVEAQSRRLLARLDAVLEHDQVLVRAQSQAGLLPARLTALRALAGEGPPGAAAGSELATVEPMRSGARSRIVADVLRRFFFLRQYLMFQSLEASLAAVALGLWTAAVLSRRDAAAEIDGDGRFGEYLATFMRAIQSPAVRKRLFDTPDEVAGYLAAFRQFWNDTTGTTG